MFDTAPSYGDSEEVAGELAAEMGFSERIFWATKVNVARGGSADPAAARAQIERSFEYFGVDVIDLIQVHNLGDPPTQVGILQELKQEGRIRYLGITSTRKQQYPALAQAMQDYPLDFIGIDYAANNTSAADEIFPIAMDQGIGILVYVPFGRNLFTRASGQELPEWAAEFGANSWAQFFLKFAAAHPAVTCVTPATSNPEHMLDNIGTAMGRLPHEDEQARMVEGRERAAAGAAAEGVGGRSTRLKPRHAAQSAVRIPLDVVESLRGLAARTGGRATQPRFAPTDPDIAGVLEGVAGHVVVAVADVHGEHGGAG